MNYIKPDQVTSPQDCVSNIRVLFDGKEGSFSLALINWNGNDCYAVRWNVAEREWSDQDKQNGNKKCVGMPSSRGYPVWFVLPDELIDKNSEIWEIINKAQASH